MSWHCWLSDVYLIQPIKKSVSLLLQRFCLKVEEENQYVQYITELSQVHLKKLVKTAILLVVMLSFVVVCGLHH